MKQTAKIFNGNGYDLILSDNKTEILAALQRYGYITPEEDRRFRTVELDTVPKDRQSLVVAYCCTGMPTVNLISTNEVELFEGVLRAEGFGVDDVNNGLNALNTKRVWQNVGTFVDSHRKRLHSIIMPIIKYKSYMLGDTGAPELYLTALELALLNGIEKRVGENIERTYNSNGAIPFKHSTPLEEIVFKYWSEFCLLGLITKDAINNPSGVWAIGRAKEICTEYYNAITIDNGNRE